MIANYEQFITNEIFGWSEREKRMKDVQTFRREWSNHIKTKKLVEDIKKQNINKLNNYFSVIISVKEQEMLQRLEDLKNGKKTIINKHKLLEALHSLVKKICEIEIPIVGKKEYFIYLKEKMEPIMNNIFECITYIKDNLKKLGNESIELLNKIFVLIDGMSSILNLDYKFEIKLIYEGDPEDENVKWNYEIIIHKREIIPGYDPYGEEDWGSIKKID